MKGPCYVCQATGQRQLGGCSACEPPAAPARWRTRLGELLPAERVAAAGIRGCIAIAGFAICEPMAAAIDPLLGKIAHTASVLFGMLALWGLLLPIESAIVEPIARRLVGKGTRDKDHR